MSEKPSERPRQKFHRGDLVHIAKDLGPSMSHFTADVDAIVEGTYSEVCRVHWHGDPYQSTIYSLILLRPGKEPSTCAWYNEDQLTLLVPRFYHRLYEVLGHI